MLFKLSLLVALVATTFGAPSRTSDEGLQRLTAQVQLPIQVLPSPGAVAGEDHDSFIINGNDVDTPGKYPWQISLQQFGSHICGGSIVGPKTVMTAAHCIVSQYLTVVVGLHSQKSTVDEDEGVRHEIAHIVVHESYNKGAGTFPNDIAVIHLKEDIKFNDKVGKVDMDLDGEYGGPSSEKKRDCVISGWGYTKLGLFPVSADILQEAKTNLLSRSQCAGYWPSYYLLDSHVCIFSGKDAQPNSACMGDSGGPLVCRDNAEEDYKLVGLTSWGSSYCTVSMPGVYTRLSSFKDWINKNA